MYVHCTWYSFALKAWYKCDHMQLRRYKVQIHEFIIKQNLKIFQQFFFFKWATVKRAHGKSLVTPVFFKLLTRFWCLNLSEFLKKSFEEG